MEHHTTTSRAEAERLLGIAEKLLRGKDFGGCRDFAILAQETEPLLEGSDQILAVAEVLAAADNKRLTNNQPDWYSILQIPQRSDDTDLIAEASAASIDEAYFSGICAGLSFRSLLAGGTFEPAAGTRDPLQTSKIEPLFTTNERTAGEAPLYNFFSEATSSSPRLSQLPSAPPPAAVCCAAHQSRLRHRPLPLHPLRRRLFLPRSQSPHQRLLLQRRRRLLRRKPSRRLKLRLRKRGRRLRRRRNQQRKPSLLRNQKLWWRQLLLLRKLRLRRRRRRRTPQLCNYALGVLDKETRVLKMVPIAANKIFRLEPRVAGLEQPENEIPDVADTTVDGVKAEKAEERLQAALQDFKAVKSSEAMALENLKFLIEKTVRNRASPSRPSTITNISKFEYEYLKGNVAEAKEIADKTPAVNGVASNTTSAASISTYGVNKAILLCKEKR